jgi:hypothetical protein
VSRELTEDFATVEHLANSRVIPGLIPGLFVAKTGFSCHFVRFSYRRQRTAKSQKPFIFGSFIGSSDRIQVYPTKLWKLGCTTASGASASTIIAATAKVRNVTARRSTMTAINTTAVMKNDRWVATSQPDSNR